MKALLTYYSAYRILGHNRRAAWTLARRQARKWVGK